MTGLSVNTGKLRQGSCSEPGCQNIIDATGKPGPMPKRCPNCKAVAERGRGSRQGKAKPPAMPRRKYQPGPVEGTQLTLLSYDETNTSYGWFKCSCRRKVRKRMAYVFVGYPGEQQKHDRTTHCGGPAHPDKRLTGDPIYNTAHKRMDREFGPAKSHPCAVCGVAGTAQWSYMWSSSDPKVQEAGKDKGRVYSINGGDYAPMCKEPCHGNWDRANQAISEGLPKDKPRLVNVVLAEIGYFEQLKAKETTA